MKTKQKADVTSAVLLILLGVVLLLCPIINFTNLNILFLSVMICYVFINIGRFFLTKDSKDYESLFMSLSSLAIGVISLFYKPEASSIHLAVLLFVWVILLSLVKLKKADYYNDRKSKLWILEIIFLVLFIIMGILTSINFNYGNDVKILLLGFFFFTHGILEFVDPIIIYLLKEHIRK